MKLNHCHSAECAQLVEALEAKANAYMEMMDANAKELDKAMDLLRWAETEMRYAARHKRVSDNHGRTDVYESIKEFLK